MAKKDLLLSLGLVFQLLWTNGTKAQNLPLTQYESAYLAQDIYPNGASALDWFPDDYEVQGVTNDGSNWFFTIVDQDKTHGIMWRIPKSIPLNGNVKGKPGVYSVNYNTIPELKTNNFWHWGDPDHLRFDGIDYILVPVNTPTPAILCFRASNLAYVNYTWLDTSIPGGGGWCAVGVDNDLYVSADDPNSIVRYDVDWKTLISTKNHNVAKFLKNYPLTKADGSKLELTDLQGGEFTPSGEMLYLVSGRGKCFGNGADWTPRDGIHAIETQNWRELAQSAKNSDPKNHFSYDYDPTCKYCLTGGGTDTPEGLTFWDLDDGSASGVRGTLHVLVDYYTIGGLRCDDKLYFHHFSPKVYADAASKAGPGLLGRKDHPFTSFGDAVNYYPIWSGAQLVLRPGVYTGKGMVINKRVKIGSEGGMAVIK